MVIIHTDIPFAFGEWLLNSMESSMKLSLWPHPHDKQDVLLTALCLNEL